jgi:transcriptional regulator with XRE-family HTH domain
MVQVNRMRVIRAERRISQLMLATVARIHPTRLWKIENGYVVPTPRERQTVASALGVSVREIWPRTVATPTELNDQKVTNPATQRGGLHSMHDVCTAVRATLTQSIEEDR